MIAVQGSIKNLTKQTGIALNVSIQGTEVANLSKITGQALPLKGAYGLSGKLSDRAGKNYRISDLKLKLGDNDITGSTDLNLSGQQLKMATALSSPKFNLQPVTVSAIETLTRIEDLGPLKLAANLTGSGAKITLDNLDLNIGSQELIEVIVKGRINDLREVSGMELEFSLRGNDLDNISTLAGPALPFTGAFNVSGRFIEPAPKVHKISSLDAAWGDNDIRGWIELDRSKNPTRLSAELSSQTVSYTHLTLPTTGSLCSSRWSPYH